MRTWKQLFLFLNKSKVYIHKVQTFSEDRPRRKFLGKLNHWIYRSGENRGKKMPAEIVKN